MKVRIFTDGACSGNPGAGGWAAIFSFENEFEVIKGHEELTTNNRMELKAVVESFKKAIKTKGADEIDFELFSDSAYVVNSINNKWVKKWSLNGWRTAKGERIKNEDLWKEFLFFKNKARSMGIGIKIIKIKGHAGNSLNEKVDKIAKEEIKNI